VYFAATHGTMLLDINEYTQHSFEPHEHVLYWDKILLFQ
jgi:hypothetical protein